ncbi:unknown protein [Seminavis robusta]|uniref:Uncharacterized protein n=1 Tax=Seminavis robusta TaxID=568900 RepID=A0A9N8DXT3_9STRA|nr:unknown protein [Seminavis robusta]|eukprot:Sro353_g124500.1 n/a (198) ;mRNA; r:37075-37668
MAMLVSKRLLLALLVCCGTNALSSAFAFSSLKTLAALERPDRVVPSISGRTLFMAGNRDAGTPEQLDIRPWQVVAFCAGTAAMIPIKSQRAVSAICYPRWFSYLLVILFHALKWQKLCKLASKAFHVSMFAMLTIPTSWLLTLPYRAIVLRDPAAIEHGVVVLVAALLCFIVMRTKNMPEWFDPLIEIVTALASLFS